MKRRPIRPGGPLRRGKPLNAVSPDRAEKRRRAGARGPLCRFAASHRCVICDRVPSDPAHIDPVGRGYGDFEWDADVGRWRGRVAPLCRPDHRIHDRNVVGWTDPGPAFYRRARQGAEAVGERWAEIRGVDLSDATHPYEQLEEDELAF